MKLKLVKIGDFPADLTDLSSRLQKVFGWKVESGTGLNPNPDDYRPGRGQYWAVPVLKDLAALYPGEPVLGVAQAGFYEAGLASVQGIHLEKGSSALVTLSGLKSEDAGLLNSRLWKLAARQIAAWLDLPPCRNCLLSPLADPGELDLLPEDFCPQCLEKLRGLSLPSFAPYPAKSLKFIYHPDFYADLAGHVFPVEKYAALYQKLRDEGLGEEDFLIPPAATREELAWVHTPEYLEDLFNYRFTPRTISSELLLNRKILRAFCLMAGGSQLGAQTALENGAALALGGGFHHAFADHAEGFCYLNDPAFALKSLQAAGKIQRAAVIDCDVHQGNGTAVIFQGDPAVFTFSIHQENLYPPKRQSSLDIGLEDGLGDEEYLSRLRKSIPAILEFFAPQLAVYLAGADPYKDDQLGGLQLTLDGLRERDELVLGRCFHKRIPVLTLLAGGYARNFADTVQIHLNTAGLMRRIFGKVSSS